MLRNFCILIFAFLILRVKTFHLECEFKFVFYTCLSENFTQLSSDDSKAVTSVIGDHFEDWNNTFVHRIALRGSNWHFFPQNLIKFFPNVQVLHIQNTKVKFLTSDDLKPFTKLTSLTISGNKIEKIPSDLFKHTKNLIDLNLDENQIKLLESESLNELKMLNFFYIRNNPCTRKALQPFARNRNDVIRLIEKLEEKCRG